MPLARRRCVSLRALALLWLLTGCDAKVKAFTASPRHVCPGERVELSWSVTGSATMTVTPSLPGAPNGPVPDDGNATIAPVASTRAQLYVKRFLGAPASSIQDVDVNTARGTERLAASLGDPSAQPGCESGNRVWATVHARNFAAAIKVGSVAAHPGDPRTYDVQHANLKVRVSPGAVSTQLAGVPIQGDWLLSATLAPGETCDKVPNGLVVDVFTQCVPGSQP